MPRPVLVVTHAHCEQAALIDVALGELPVLRRSILDEHDPGLPAVSDLAGVVVMGGPQDANADERYPGLRAERRLLAEAVSADVPVLGVCLGMQLLGVALGARLHLRHGAEVGFLPIELTTAGAADPVVGAFAQHTTVLHWHSDAVELPAGTALLASTPTTPVQAFRIGSALGTQFHPEADAELLATWLTTSIMVEGLAPAALARIRADGAALLPGLRPVALRGFAAFAAAVERRM
ncbi:MAG: type 1 glutamine amidotransferase [Kofleriaceae bacterium]|nr:type 1 glutamine amidotransferase [Kofleriaceae bacterium]